MILLNASSEFLKAMTLPIGQMSLKFDIFDSNDKYIETVTQYITLDDIGHLIIDRSRPVRRSFSFGLDNSNGIFTWREDGLIWLDKKIQLFIGFKNGNDIHYVSEGIFYLTGFSTSHTNDANKTYITGCDKMFKYTDQRGKFTAPLTIQAGTNIAVAIKQVVSDETLFNFDAVTDVTSNDITFEIGSNRYDAIKTLANIAKADIYYDANGYLRLKKIDLNDLQNYPVVWTYEYGNSQERFYAGNIRTIQTDNLVNHVIVYGGSSQSEINKYEIVVDETNSIWAGNPYSIQRIGDYLYLFNNGNPDPSLVTQDDCKFVCQSELMNRLGYSELVELAIVPNYLLDCNDIIKIEDSSNGATGRYLIEYIDMPLLPQEMVIRGYKERMVINDWNNI